MKMTIADDREYEVALATVARLEQALTTPSTAFDPTIMTMLRSDVEEELRIQRLRIARYELIRQGRAQTLDLPSFEDFPTAFLFARLALGLSQATFAERLGIAEDDVRHYEETRYAEVTLGCLTEFARRLGLLMSHELIVPLPAPADTA